MIADHKSNHFILYNLLKKNDNYIKFFQYFEKVKAKIDSRNEVNTNITVLDQEIAEQRKLNELEELRAQQNIIRSKGLTPQLLQEAAIEKWSGVMPTTVTGGSTIMSIPIK